MLTFGDLGMTPEEVETLQISPTCAHCRHRLFFHETEEGFCLVNGCCCSEFEGGREDIYGEGADDPDSLAYRGTGMGSGCHGCGAPDDCYCPSEE